MDQGCTIVVDVGKTNAKASMWDAEGRLVDWRSRANTAQTASGYRALDVAGIDRWLIESLTAFAQRGVVTRIVTAGHGAAAALLQRGQLFAAPMDYEDEVAAAEREEYVAQRDAFIVTGSPALPCGLNLGMQLHRYEKLLGPLPDDVTIVPWAQYWAWRLCGVAASEVSSLGCHTDLWRPLNRDFSALAVRRGWAARMAPIRLAGEPLGTITAQIATQTQLPGNCVVLCGLHDSNAALLAARGHAQIANGDATVLSTGTWFVAMRSLAAGAAIHPITLADSRDCLVNVDVAGRPVPSARFMGGREAQLIGGVDSFALTADYNPDDLLSRLSGLVASGSAAFPSFVSGVGPFPASIGAWRTNTGLEDFFAWMRNNFDATVTWDDLEFIRREWQGPLIVKGILDIEDALAAQSLGADGIVVSNHGGRQLDGVPSTASALPPIADKLGDSLTVLVDGGIRSGLDVIRMLALGADGVLLGRAWVYALAAQGQAGVTHVLQLIEAEMRVAMALTGVTRIDAIDRGILVNDNDQ